MISFAFHKLGRTTIPLALAFAVSSPLLGGCGAGPQQKQDRGFFTSGNREADQRADQRMAKSEQLKGTGGSGGGGGGGAAASKADAQRPLYERLGAEKGLTAIVDDFTARALADPRVNWQRTGVTRGGFTIHRN